MTMNAKQLSVGLMTSVVVMRSLSGATTAGFNKEEQLNNLRREGQMLMRNQVGIKQKENNLTSQTSMEVAEQMRLEKEKFILERFSGVEGQKRLNLAKKRLLNYKNNL